LAGKQNFFRRGSCLTRLPSPLTRLRLTLSGWFPHRVRRTLTVDNGKEFSAHKSLAQTLEIDICFAHAYHSWERGLNEHTNGLIRQCLPKKVPFTTLTQG
jgi:IS30 family transposase